MLLVKKIHSKWNKIKSPSFRGALVASGVMAFAGLGDAMLYPILPIYGEEMGFSVFSIGLVLSVNRFVRIIANTPIANLVYKIGMKKMIISCSILALITTISYGFPIGIICFLIARIIWGISYAGLKIATLNYAAQVKTSTGLAFGLSKSIKSTGGLLALWLCPILIAATSVDQSFFIIGWISALGILMAVLLPTIPTQNHSEKVKTKKTFYPSTMNLLVFILAITIDGILVVVLSSLLINNYTDTTQLLAMVAFYLLLRRLFEFGFSFIGGIISLKVLPIKLFMIAVIFCIIGLLLIVLDYISIGIIIAFLFNTIVITFAPLVAIQQQSAQQNALQAISSVSTWWDLGAAIGAFAGLYLVTILGTQKLFLLLFISILFIFIPYIVQHRESFKKVKEFQKLDSN